MNSKRGFHISLNSTFSSCASFFVHIAQIKAKGTNMAAKYKHTIETINPKTSPFMEKSFV